MSKLKAIRELQNMTQEELAEKSGVSARTIQRIESGKEPKGYTLRVLANALAIAETELITKEPEQAPPPATQEQISHINDPINFSALKLINLMTIPFVVLPPLNIIVPLILMFFMKQKNQLTKQLISVQILWTILAPIIFLLGIFLKPGRQLTLVLMILIVLSNVYIILHNAIAIDKNKKLHYTLNFNLI